MAAGIRSDKGSKMNYATTITAETQGAVAANGGVRHDHTSGSNLTRNLMIIAGALFALLLAIAAYFALLGAPTDSAGDQTAQAPVVTVISPGVSSVSGVIEASGALAARRPMPVGAVGEGGQVVQVRVDAGDWVQKGQVMAVIDRSVQAQQAVAQQAQVEVARADANLAQANLDRAMQLVERGFVSTADMERLTATRDSAAARVKVAEAQLAELRARTARLNIVAPAQGYVLNRNVEPGQTVGGGSGALFTLARGGEMEMLAQLSESQMAKLSRGDQASVTPAGSDVSHSGEVWQLSPTVDQRTRLGTARIALPFSSDLRPGGFATARIDSGTIEAIVLPESAVLADEDGSFVYAIGEENKAVRTPVTIGATTAQGVAITDGLAGEEMVVLQSGGFLNPGETVNPRLRGGE